MDRVRNPFAPGPGNPPPELAGRGTTIDQAEVALRRAMRGRSAQGMMLAGLRGVGKTVLLGCLRELSGEGGFGTVALTAYEGGSLAALLLPALRDLLFSLSGVEPAREKARRGLRVLRSFLDAAGGGRGLEIGLDPEPGVADSGDRASDLAALLTTVADAAVAGGRPIALIVDDLHHLDAVDHGALVMAAHRIGKAGLPFVLFGAGLPGTTVLAGEAQAQAERLFGHAAIGALPAEDATAALRGPIEREGATITPAALTGILTITEGYPCFLQQWGHDAWNVAEGPEIGIGDVYRASTVAIRALDERFFKVRLDRCTPAERRYMRALAELGPGAHRSGAVAGVLGTKTTSVGPTRGKLIRKAMLYAPAHGDTAFAVPMFDAYLRRTMEL